MGVFVRRLLGKSAKPPPEVADALAELARLAKDRPALAGQAALLADVLPRLYEEPVTEVPPALDAEQAAAKLAGGVPLLAGEMLDVDVRALGRRLLRIGAAVQTTEAADLARALKSAALDLRGLVAELLAGRPEALHAAADQHGLDAGLLATAFRLALFPVLNTVRAALAPLRERRHWEQGHCPTCGSWPLLGEFRGLEQRRILRCGLCADEWEFPRLRCPFCGTTDHHQLGYLHVEGEEGKSRAATCAACRGYVKMSATLFPLTASQLLVMDVTLLHLDLVAAQHGYAVPG